MCVFKSLLLPVKPKDWTKTVWRSRHIENIPAPWCFRRRLQGLINIGTGKIYCEAVQGKWFVEQLLAFKGKKIRDKDVFKVVGMWQRAQPERKQFVPEKIRTISFFDRFLFNQGGS